MDKKNSTSRIKQRKEQAKQILLYRDFDKLDEWARADRNPLRTTTSLLFEEELLIIWRAIEAVGIVARIEAGNDIEIVRKHIRRLFWLMNDESGGLCRRAPEAIGEILVNVPELINEYGQMLLSFLWEEPFERGIRSAIYRLLNQERHTMDIFEACAGDLLKSLEHEDDIIRGYSYLILDQMNKTKLLKIDIPEFESVTVPFYDFSTGELRSITLP